MSTGQKNDEFVYIGTTRRCDVCERQRIGKLIIFTHIQYEDISTQQKRTKITSQSLARPQGCDQDKLSQQFTKRGNILGQRIIYPVKFCPHKHEIRIINRNPIPNLVYQTQPRGYKLVMSNSSRLIQNFAFNLFTLFFKGSVIDESVKYCAPAKKSFLTQQY